MNSKIVKLVALITLSALLNINLALAQEIGKPSDASPTTTNSNGIQCPDLNNLDYVATNEKCALADSALRKCLIENNNKTDQCKDATTAKNKQCKDIRTTTELKDIVVITEEPIAVSNKTSIKNCARKTVCTTTKTTVDGKPSTSFRNCYSEYVEVDQCTASDGQSNDSTVTTCEYVQVFTAPSGTNLLYVYIGALYQYAAGLGGILAVLLMIIGGIQVASAGGDANKMAKAKELITKSLTGLIVLFLSAVILYTINPNFFTW